MSYHIMQLLMLNEAITCRRSRLLKDRLIGLLVFSLKFVKFLTINVVDLE